MWFYFVGIYVNRSVAPDVAVGTDVLINIIFMMLVFLSSEKAEDLYEKMEHLYNYCGSVSDTAYLLGACAL